MRKEFIKGCLYVNFEGLLDIRGYHQIHVKEHKLPKRGCEDQVQEKAPTLLKDYDGQDTKGYQSKEG